MSTDTNELAHYGVKGMRWGVSRKKATLASGAAAGAAGGAALATYATKKATATLRSKATSKAMAAKALKMSDLNKLSIAVAKPFVARKIHKKNQKIADLLSNPKSVATIAVGGALAAGLVGVGIAAAANRISDSVAKRRSED